jgi:hypothetical protein
LGCWERCAPYALGFPNQTGPRAAPGQKWKSVLRNPETGKPFVLYEAQVEFLRRAFVLTGDGRLPFPEIIFSAPKKSGKTALAAMCAIYVAVVIGGPFAEIYCLSNDFEQSQGRVFQAAARIIQASPLLAGSAKITADKIMFPSTNRPVLRISGCAHARAGAFIALLASTHHPDGGRRWFLNSNQGTPSDDTLRRVASLSEQFIAHMGRGRPSKLTSEVAQLLLEAYRSTGNLRTSAHRAGVSASVVPSLAEPLRARVKALHGSDHVAILADTADDRYR